MLFLPRCRRSFTGFVFLLDVVWWSVVLSQACGSMGIGLATVQALAAQGLNVLLVAMPDALLTAATKELSEKYKAQVGEACVCKTARPTPAPHRATNPVCVGASYQRVAACLTKARQ